jgi:hypothetical protein
MTGVMGFVMILEALKRDGVKINEDDLPRFLNKKFRKVSYQLKNQSIVAYAHKKTEYDNDNHEYKKLKRLFKREFTATVK